MKTFAVIQNKFVSILTIFGLTVLVSLILSAMPALGTTEFEFGTQFGISHIIPEGDDSTTTITYTRLPSSTFLDTSSAPTSLYATWFPSQQFGIGPEFSFGRFSFSSKYSTESITSLYLGGQAAFFLGSHTESTPYILGRVSRTSLFSSDSYNNYEAYFSFGLGVGYQWRIRSAFVLRGEAQYQRLLVEDDNANQFSLIIGIGTRFGNNEK